MELSVFTSSDYGKTFEKNIIETNGSAFAPRIYTTNENEFIIFFSESQNNQFSISYSVSKDGKNWESVKSFNSSGNLLNPFIPVLIPLKKYGGNLLVFQAQYLNQETHTADDETQFKAAVENLLGAVKDYDYIKNFFY